MLRWVISVAVLLAFAAAPASADVDAYATIFKDKDITVTEWINIDKNVDVDVTVDVEAESVAEAFALLNQTNNNNHACSACAEKTDYIDASANDNSGIVTVNQAAGNNNNQGAAISLAIDDIGGGGPPPDNPDAEDGFAHAQAHADQRNMFNTIDAVELAFRDAWIDASFNGNNGVIHGNQSAGNNNNQGNVLAMGVSLLGTGVALAESDLGQENRNNRNFESQLVEFDGPAHVGINKEARLNGSVNSNSGIVGINQSAGNNGNQANVVSFAFATSPTNSQ